MSKREGVTRESRIVAVRSRDQLADAIKKSDTGAAVFEAPQHPLATEIARLNCELLATLEVWIHELSGRSVLDTAAFDRVAAGAKERIVFADVAISEREALARVIDAIVEDLKSLLKQFSGYTIGSIAVKTGENGAIVSNREWHTDGNISDLNIVRTYVGPSTEYADDVDGTGHKKFKKGAITVHKGMQYHRGPDRDGTNRVAIVVRLRRTK